MTTIVYRDGILATDRQMVATYHVLPAIDKLVLVKTRDGKQEYAVALSGILSMGLAFIEWLKVGLPEGGYRHKIVDKMTFQAIYIRRNSHGGKPTVMYQDELMWPLDETAQPYSAEGAGNEIAIGALYQGATAVEAVRAANHHHAHSGFGIMWVDMAAADFKIQHIREGE